MKITGIEIERFGQWNQLSLPLASDGLTVILGANESGKSALRRFIRGVLFGFRGDDVSEYEAWSRRLPCVGALRVRHRGQVIEIRRAVHDGGAGSVTTRWLPPANATVPSRSLIEHCRWETDDESPLEIAPDDEVPTVPLSDTLAELLGDLPERMFDHVFSLGLCELHELTTLSDEEVAKAVHGETLGPDGQKLLTARDRLSDAIDRRWDEFRHGSLPKLLEQYGQLSDQIQSQAQRLARYTDLIRTLQNHEHRLTELQSRRANVREQLRGYTHIERVWTPWQRLRNLQAERLRLPRIDDFPEGGISRFDLVEQELLAAVNCHDSLITEAKQLHREAKKIAVPRELRRTASAMRNLFEQREHTARLEERARQAHMAMTAQRDKLDQLVQTLGPEWSLARLEGLDTSIAAHYRLVEKARQFRRAIARRNRWKVRLVRLSQTCQQHTTELDEALKKLNGLSLDEALRKARQRQAAVPVASVIAPAERSAVSFAAGDLQVEHLPMRIVELEQRRVSISRQIERLEPRLILPTWVLSVLGFFALGGVLLAIIGLMTGISTSALGGAAYALLGTAFTGLALSLKTHVEQQVRESIGQLHEELRDNEARLRDARDAWQQFVGVPPSGSTLDVSARVDVANLAAGFAGRGASETISTIDVTSFSLDELERLQETKTRIARWQQQRGLWRDRFDAAARELTAARQAWCQTLTQFGLPECVRVNDSFELWQRLAAANEQRRTWQAAEIEFKRHVEAVQNIRSRVLEISHRLNRRDLDQMPTLEVFQLWEAELHQLSATLQERLRLRRDERRRRAEAAEYREKIDDLRQQRSALLRQGCATDRDDYARRAIIVTRHEELNRQIDDTKAELDAASRAIPELAIVEDDLVRFDASRHVELLQRLRSEADDTDREIEQLQEELGGMRHEIENLEADDEPSDLRLEREILRSQIQAAAERWLADEWVAHALDEIRARYERICQPGILAAASRYLARLTEGRYRTLWTPLRHRSLQVDDASGNTCRLEQLSGSTRELLLLSIRLALVEEFGRRGIDLPLLLDDVLLTLDPSRAAVAANELIDFARHGHQVLLFTCHPHLANLFTMAGCPNIRLSQITGVAERLAG